MSFVIPQTFDAFQTSEQVQLLNTVDALRTCRLDGMIPLPQLVVCGGLGTLPRNLFGYAVPGQIS